MVWLRLAPLVFYRISLPDDLSFSMKLYDISYTNKSKAETA
jgi:uncharacterized lipoprotein YbaY